MHSHILVILDMIYKKDAGSHSKIISSWVPSTVSMVIAVRKKNTI